MGVAVDVKTAMERWVPRPDGMSEAEHNELVVEVAKSIPGLGIDSTARDDLVLAHFRQFLRKPQNHRNHTDVATMWDSVIAMGQQTDLSDKRGTSGTGTNQPDDTEARKSTKSIPPEFKDVAKEAYQYIQQNPRKAHQLENLNLASLEAGTLNLPDSMKSLVMAPESVQRKLEGTLGNIVRHLFQLSVDQVEIQAFPVTAQTAALASSPAAMNGKSSFRAAAETLVRGDLSLKPLKDTWLHMAKVDDRVQDLVNKMTSQDLKSQCFPRDPSCWPEVGAYWNQNLVNGPLASLGNLVSIPVKMTQDGVSVIEAAAFMDLMLGEVTRELHLVVIGQKSFDQLPTLQTTFANQFFTAKLRACYNELIQSGLVERTIRKRERQSQSAGSSGGGGSGGGAIGDGNNGGGEETTAKRAELQHPPQVSQNFNLASPELASDALMKHPGNKIGHIPLLRACRLCVVKLEERECVLDRVFGYCPDDDYYGDGYNFQHKGKALSDEKRLQVARKARDLIEAGLRL